MTKRANLAAALHEAGAKSAHVIPSSTASASPQPRTSHRAVAPSIRPPSRTGLRAVTVYAKPEAHRQLRQMGLDRGISVQDLMIEALNDLFRKHGKSLIA
jgi:hypothetical protein